MTVKETTTFECGQITVTVDGSDIYISTPMTEHLLDLDRAEARDLSKALNHAADIVKSKRKRPQVGSNA